MALAIKVENLSKAYQLGEIGTGTLSNDLERWVAKIRGKEDPFLKIGETNDRTTKGASNVVWSLKDINFEINEGDAVGIIGRNGAGKSTLLKLLSRVTSPTTGNFKVKGRIASLLEVGTGFHPELTGRENIYLNGAILGMRKKEIQQKFDEIVDFSGVERYVDTPVKRYSSGMYVRLAFAVAAHLESEILIVDEVLAVGDAEFQKKCLGKMGEVSKGEGRTVLFVSHNMGSIKKLCSKGVLLKNGELDIFDGINKTVNQYFNSAIQNRDNKPGIVVWDNDTLGKDGCYLYYIAIIQDELYVDTIDSTKSFLVEVGYRIDEDVADFSIGINILNSSDEVILHSSDIFSVNLKLTSKRSKGFYVSKCVVPVNYLNTGTYSINVSADIPNVKLFFYVESAIKFSVENVSILASKYSADLWKGFLGPESVTWQLEKKQSHY